MTAIIKKIITFILRLESRLVLWKYKPKVIAITGSVGKTSTKDAVYAALSGMSYVRKSEKSYNSEIGLPLTILGCPNGWNDPLVWLLNILKGISLFIFPYKYPSWLVLEAGIGKPGDMRRTASWLKTDAVIITTIGNTPVHIEFFESHKHLVDEKSQIIRTLKKDGILILNSDDEVVSNLKSRTKNLVITYGFGEGADVRGSEENILYDEERKIPKGVLFRVDDGGKSLPVAIEGVFGRNHIYAALGAIALCKALKLNLLEAIDKLKNYSIPPGRMRLLQGINDSFIIDDSYNSSPVASLSGLKTLQEVEIGEKRGRKIAVLGDMLELGRHTEEAHINIGKEAKQSSDILFVVGPRSKKIKEGALEAGMKAENILEFDNSKMAGEYLRNFVRKNDLVLIKGSQGMRMEFTVEAILEDIKNKKDLLVRQEDEWLAKK